MLTIETYREVLPRVRKQLELWRQQAENSYRIVAPCLDELEVGVVTQPHLLNGLQLAIETRS